MIGEMNREAYFKEYLCLDFAISLDEQVSGRRSITFAEGGDADVQGLPSVVVDQIGKDTRLFLLNWEAGIEHGYLQIKEINDQEWIRVDFNVLPEIVAIAEGRLFAISGGELVIQEIYKDRQRLLRIGEGKIVAVKPSMVKYQGKEGEAYEAGISIYFFSESSGYLARHFSLHSQPANQSLKNVVNMVLFKKYLEFAHFQVIVPNLFALVFLNDSEFCVFNLHTWQIEESTRSRLICNRLQRGSEPVIRWRQHLIGKQYDYGLFVAIGIGSNIEIHFICLKYLPSHAELFKDARLDSLINGNFINWQESIILPDVNISIDGSCLDIAITKRGITYYSKDHPNSQISNCSYIDLNSAFPFPAILTQQAIIWRKYYQDKAFDGFTDGNRFFVPNRYPLQLVLRMHQKGQYEQMRADLLNAWRKQYRFKGIVTYKEEMLIVRAGSINAFRVVNQELYNFQHFSQEKLVRLDQIVDVDKIDREVQNLFIRPNSLYEERIFHSEADRPTLKQRRYKLISEENYQPAEDAEAIADHKFQMLMRELQQIMAEQIGNAYSTMNVPQFLQTLTCNQLYDKLNYYHLIANNKAFRLASFDLREYSKEYELYSCTIRLISYFYELLERSQQHYLLFQNSLIGLFVDSHRGLLSSDIDTSVYSYIKLLFENLFPVKKSNYANSQINAEDAYDNEIKKNAFIEFLVEKLISLSHSGLPNRQPMITMMREQLGNIVKIGLLDMKSLYFSNLWKNQSLYKALLLGGSQHLNSYFCQYLLKNRNSDAGFLEVYKSISPYMLQEDIAIIQNQLFFNLNCHELVPDMAVLSKTMSHVESELDSHPETIARIKQDILSHHKFNNQIDQEKISKSVLQELEELSYVFDEKRWMRVNERLGEITFSEEEKYLEYYEQATAGLVRLFNSRVSIEGWKPNELTQRQSLLLSSKRKELMENLGAIEHFFRLYKQQYTHVYEQTIQPAEQSGSEVLREYDWEMLLLKERFITDTSHLMLIKDDGLLCCSLTIHMLKLALTEAFSHSLEQTDNLIFFWLKWVQDSELSIYQAARYIQTIFLFSREEVKKQLSHHEDLSRRLTSICSTLSNESNINYAFFELVKGSNRSTN